MNITYVSACMDASGYAEAARNHIAALDSAGVTINVVPISFEGYRSDLGKLGAIIQGMVGRNPGGKIQIIHATPENYPRVIKREMYNIGYVAWETDKIPHHWGALLNTVDELWVPSEHNKQVLINCEINKPIHVMPHPFNVVDNKEDTTGIVANISKDDYVFYSIFQWIERKNPVDLLKAFLTEFKHDEKVALVLKTYIVNPNNAAEAKRLRERIVEIKGKLHLKNFPKILLISSLLSRGQIRTLHQQCDCYISLHRCEGFGIPLAEAMLAKNPVIATRYGGPEDFMQNQMLVDYHLTPVYGMPWNHYTGDMRWAQPDLQQARDYMRWVFENRKQGRKMGEEGYKHITEELSWSKVGIKMRERLEQIKESL